MTIRQHLEANEQLLGFALIAAGVAAPLTLEEAIKQARKHAVAALRDLDSADIDIMKSGTEETVDGVRFLPERRYRSVPDPVAAATPHRGGCRTCSSSGLVGEMQDCIDCGGTGYE